MSREPAAEFLVINDDDYAPSTLKASRAILNDSHHRTLTKSYISLLGARQLATGIILLTLVSQHKWTEIATVLAIIGIVVAGTNGIYISCNAV